MKPPGRRCRRRHCALQAMILACASPGHALAQPPGIDTADPTRDAYLDETARRLVHGARAARVRETVVLLSARNGARTHALHAG